MHADLLSRPALIDAAAIAAALDGLGDRDAATPELWRSLTERFTVDLDAVAAILPALPAEIRWLPKRG